jgi:hypothetical protein
MKALTLNQAVLRLFQSATSLVEVRDAQGTIIGFFAPASIEHASEYARAAAQFYPRRQLSSQSSGRTYTTQEVLDYLDSLESSFPSKGAS